MKTTAFLLPLALIAACSSAASPPDFTANTCDAVNAVLAAGSTDNPYSVFRGEPAMLGDRVLDDKWVANKAAFGETCQINIMRNMFGADIYTYSCDLYSSPGSLNKDEKEAEARAEINRVKDTIASCLGDDWVMDESTEDPDVEIYQKYDFEPVSGRPGADEFDFTVDPIYVEMSYTPFMRGRGGPSGWLAKVQFQEQRKMAE
ncbi:MAG: hypothetical protein CMK07_12530 [Ponticaulis sp.]|nr:hypothetical protein [Ponticaulis sp.]